MHSPIGGNLGPTERLKHKKDTADRDGLERPYEKAIAKATEHKRPACNGTGWDG